MKMGKPLGKLVWWFLRKLDILLSEYPVMPLFGTYLKIALIFKKDTCTTMFIAVILIKA